MADEADGRRSGQSASFKDIWVALLGLLVYTLLPLLMMPLAGAWDWIGGWIMLASSVLFGVGGRLWAFRRFPGLLRERGRSLQAEDAKDWDKRLVGIVALFGPLIVLLLAGLDKRWDWSMTASPLTLSLGSGFTLLGYTIATWALLSNPFFSGTVRIQRDRDHRVIDQGPYAWLRHPGYAGALISYLGFPFLLDSWWVLLPIGAICAALVYRTSREDQTLQLELPGYREYASRVQYRLLPFVW
jgi:protein-S-isoprenylcysteine O-methyltransferase Ste14